MTTRTQTTGRVAHLTSVHPAFDVRIFHKECKSIARAGYHVTLIAGHDRDETVDGVHLKAVPRRKGRLTRMVRTTASILREALREDADLYHFHDPELIPVGLLLRLKGKIVVYDAHEDVAFDVALKHYIPRLLRRPVAWVIDRIESSSSAHFSACVAATKPIGRRFASRTSRTTVISNYPVNDEQPALHKPWRERSASVAYVGMLSEDRCIAEIVQAMALLPEKKQVTLNLAGVFSPPTLATDVTHIKGWDRVNMLGTVRRPEVARVLSDARAGLVLYRPDPNSLECAPNKLFEYMQAGIPVIASDFPGFRQIVSETKCGLLANPLDPAEIARAIEYIFSHPEEAEQMGLRGRQAVIARFNWSGEERKLLELYDNLFDSSRKARAGIGRAGTARSVQQELRGVQE
jgi:glycosyltransferase involved in cell wall biosynthesis